MGIQCKSVRLRTEKSTQTNHKRIANTSLLDSKYSIVVKSINNIIQMSSF